MDPREPVRRPAPSPEIVAVASAVVLWALLGLGSIAGVGAPAPTVATTPSPAVIARTPAPSSLVDGSLLVLIRSTNAQLLDHRKTLTSLLGAASIDTAEVAATVRQVNAAANFASGITERIAAQPGGGRIAAALDAAYDPILVVADEINSLALANEPGYRAGAERLVELLGRLPDIDALVSPTAAATSSPARTSPSPGSTPSPKPTSSPTATPTPSPGPTDTPGPSASPSATPAHRRTCWSIRDSKRAPHRGSSCWDPARRAATR
jgi:hypothetical protein